LKSSRSRAAYWTQAEEDKLIKAVNTRDEEKWVAAAAMMPERSKLPWTDEQEKRLVRLIKNHPRLWGLGRSKRVGSRTVRISVS
jgi:hypothetical protein